MIYMNEHAVDEVICVGPKNMINEDYFGSKRKWPRPIVVKLMRRRTRD